MSASEPNSVNWRPDARAIAEQMKPLLMELENERQKAISKQKRAVTACVSTIAGGVAIGVLLISLYPKDALVPVLMLTIIAVIVAIIIYNSIGGNAAAEYRQRYKHNAFRQAVKMVAPGVEYSPVKMISQSTFKRSGLYNSRIDRFQGEDCFQGKVGSTDILFSELHVERKEVSHDSEGRSRTRWVTVFKGIYLVADFHKNFKGWVIIEPDYAEANFGWLGRKLQGLSGNLLRLENPEFERAFKVRASDQVEARYLLTPDMQERFLALRRRWPTGIAATLIDSNLHIAIPKQENWFEASIHRSALDPSQLGEFLQQMVMTLHIAEQLDLNTRLWTK